MCNVSHGAWQVCGSWIHTVDGLILPSEDNRLDSIPSYELKPPPPATPVIGVLPDVSSQVIASESVVERSLPSYSHPKHRVRIILRHPLLPAMQCKKALKTAKGLGFRAPGQLSAHLV